MRHGMYKLERALNTCTCNLNWKIYSAVRTKSCSAGNSLPPGTSLWSSLTFLHADPWKARLPLRRRAFLGPASAPRHPLTSSRRGIFVRRRWLWRKERRIWEEFISEEGGRRRDRYKERKGKGLALPLEGHVRHPDFGHGREGGWVKEF